MLYIHLVYIKFISVEFNDFFDLQETITDEESTIADALGYKESKSVKLMSNIKETLHLDLIF